MRRFRQLSDLQLEGRLYLCRMSVNNLLKDRSNTADADAELNEVLQELQQRLGAEKFKTFLENQRPI